MNGDITLNLLVIGLLVLANAFFVAAEFALVRVRRTRIQELIANGNATAKVVKDVMDHLQQYISVTQVGITLASLALGWIGEPFLADSIVEPFLARAFGAVLSGTAIVYWSHGVGIGIAFFLITYIHVVVGELLPKNLALHYPERMSLYLVRPLRFCAFLFRPLVWLLHGTSSFFARLMGITPAHPHSLALSEEELLLLLSESKKAGVVSEDEQRMLQRVFKFHDKTVREIMIPRPDIVALDLRAKVDQIQNVFSEGYSRLPVYDGAVNNIKGIVYVKDLIYTLQDPKLIKLIDLLRECIFVPESKGVAALLREFQKARVHMAIVVDEFGDTAGLVTLEDVIEEIVGEIQDEYDSEPAQVERGKDGTIVFEGKTDLDRFKEIFPHFPFPEGSFETVAGLVFQLVGRVPRESEVFRHGDLAFKIVKRDGRRLRRIAVKQVTEPGALPASESVAAQAVPQAEGHGANASGLESAVNAALHETDGALPQTAESRHAFDEIRDTLPEAESHEDTAIESPARTDKRSPSPRPSAPASPR